MPTVNIDVGGPLTGMFTADLQDNSGIPPTDVVRTSDAFSIKCTWYIDGGLASSLGGTWYIQAAFESIGPGPEFRSTAQPVALDGRIGSNDPYESSILFPAGENFPDGTAKVYAGERSEPYQVTVLLSHADVKGDPGPMAASVDLGELTIYA